MEALEAIYGRRATRAYAPDVVDEATVRKLLDASVQAPSAMNVQPWAFVVVQDKARLDRISERAKALLLERAHASPKTTHYADLLASRAFNVFYDAGTLIVICGKTSGAYLHADCWLAAQNLQLAAHATGLGTCCIGFAVPVLNEPDIKAELGIPADVTAVAPVIVGKPSTLPPSVPRKPPVILSWLR